MTIRHESAHGFSLVEVLVTVGLLAVLAGAAIPHLRNFNYDLWGSHALLMFDLRQARSDAMTRGDHFRLTVTGTQTYEVRRLRDPGNTGVWTPDGAPIVQRTLPTTLSFTAGMNAVFEFNTRGLLADPNSAQPIVLYDSHSKASKTVTVWPSGQIAPVEVG